MDSERLFGNDITPMCKYCSESIQRMGEHILCAKRGVVSAEYSCRRFRYDPLKRIPPKPLLVEVFADEDFSIT